MTENLGSKFKSESTFSVAAGKVTGLPRGYGDTKIVILPRDPMWFYAYWEVAPAAYDVLRKRLGEDTVRSSRWVLRVYDITGVEFNGTNAVRSFDVDVNPEAYNWYINVSELNRIWVVDLGVVTPEGDFVPVARSNVLGLPRQGVSPITDEQWAVLQQEFDRLLKLSGVDKIGRSSFDIAKLMRERWEEIVSVSLPTSPGGASSWRGVPGEEARPKGFWLKADTELIVYGATEPDARLTVAGQPVSLKPDGSFSLRFYLPDGTQEYPIEAVSSDGTMKRQITFVVRRDTK